MKAAYVSESIYKPHLDDLRKYCFYLTKSKWDGEDLFQDALLRAMQYFMYSAPHENMKPFLLRVARNLWVDACRKRQRRRQQLFRIETPIYRDSDYVEVADMLDWLFERLPRRNLQMWLLSEYFGYTIQEIADLTRMTLPAVKSVLHRTRVLLRRLKREEAPHDLAGRYHHPAAERWSSALLKDRPQDLLPEISYPSPCST